MGKPCERCNNSIYPHAVNDGWIKSDIVEMEFTWHCEILHIQIFTENQTIRKAIMMPLRAFCKVGPLWT